jgi:hypothetical protein
VFCEFLVVSNRLAASVCCRQVRLFQPCLRLLDFPPFHVLKRRGVRLRFIPPRLGRLASKSSFAELLLGALRMPDVVRSSFVRPALFPRLAKAARGRFARLDSPLREVRFHGFTFNFSAAASLC